MLVYMIFSFAEQNSPRSLVYSAFSNVRQGGVNKPCTLVMVTWYNDTKTSKSINYGKWSYSLRAIDLTKFKSTRKSKLKITITTQMMSASQTQERYLLINIYFSFDFMIRFNFINIRYFFQVMDYFTKKTFFCFSLHSG